MLMATTEPIQPPPAGFPRVGNDVVEPSAMSSQQASVDGSRQTKGKSALKSLFALFTPSSAQQRKQAADSQPMFDDSAPKKRTGWLPRALSDQLSERIKTMIQPEKSKNTSITSSMARDAMEFYESEDSDMEMDNMELEEDGANLLAFASDYPSSSHAFGHSTQGSHPHPIQSESYDFSLYGSGSYSFGFPFLTIGLPSAEQVCDEIETSSPFETMSTPSFISDLLDESSGIFVDHSGPHDQMSVQRHQQHSQPQRQDLQLRNPDDLRQTSQSGLSRGDEVFHDIRQYLYGQDGYNYN